jgi:hypothetical protein
LPWVSTASLPDLSGYAKRKSGRFVHSFDRLLMLSIVIVPQKLGKIKGFTWKYAYLRDFCASLPDRSPSVSALQQDFTDGSSVSLHG